MGQSQEAANWVIVFLPKPDKFLTLNWWSLVTSTGGSHAQRDS